ncbi:Protein of unknown function [Desulfurobacterium pacificum]|uniref:DUF2905 domain-containing protein n=1 Tax=Desulfurobacterium pacificum TaxID=240166 RepID=A0ABY1NT55_9BACT|nr:DUF2905 domain-containing protein [Desulfurobacterium pacificum]SMP17515.1 Protein of unknown function [Desulfurobacterium pacificum]
MEEVGKMLVYGGILLIITGLFIIIISKAGSGFPIGRLPGDIYIKKDNFVFYFPLGTSLLISFLLSALSFLFFLIMRKQ